MRSFFEIKVFLVKVISYIIRDHIMGRSHKSVIIVIKTFDLKSKFTYHQRTHNGKKPFKYGHCNKTFDLKTNFTFHQKTHIGEKPFKCEEWDKSFVQKVDLVCHQRTHNGEKLCKCSQCYVTFT